MTPTGWQRLWPCLRCSWFGPSGAGSTLPMSLILHLALGWWAGFLVLVLLLRLHMTPPRGDNWAGCLGMAFGLLWYCSQTGLYDLARAALYSGFIGGIGFAAASMLKLVEVTSGYQTNWHSILEQTTGLFNGIAIAVVVADLARRTRSLDEPPDHRPWTEPFALGFVLLGITYLNLRKNVAQWVGTKSMPAEMAGLSAWAWFNWGYVALALAFFVLWMRHTKRPLAVIPPTWSGKGQALYLGLLWWLVAGNFERALVAFTSERLVTEGVLYLVALACTLVLLLAAGDDRCANDGGNLDPGRARTITTGRDHRRGSRRRDAVDRCRLGDRAGNLRRSIRRPLQVAHPFRLYGDNQPSRKPLKHSRLRSGARSERFALPLTEHRGRSSTANTRPRRLSACRPSSR